MTLDIPDEREAQWLISQGVPDTAMLETPCLRAGRVRFLKNETFEFADDGQRALIFRVVDSGTRVGGNLHAVRDADPGQRRTILTVLDQLLAQLGVRGDESHGMPVPC